MRFKTLRGIWQRDAINLRTPLGYDWLSDRASDLQHNIDYEQWNKHVIPVSRVKRLTRIIYRSPPGFEPQISVAVTKDSTTGDEGAPTREIEVAVRRLDRSNDWDFYAYDADGQLQPYSEFPAGRRDAPTVCVSCHYDSRQGTVSRLLPQEQE